MRDYEIPAYYEILEEYVIFSFHLEGVWGRTLKFCILNAKYYIHN